MQFIKCRFREGDARLYTYANSGPAVAVGDFVKVPDKSGDGWKKVEVAEIDVPEPTQFSCKEILGKVEDEPEAKPEAPYTIIEEDFLDGLTAADFAGGFGDKA